MRKEREEQYRQRFEQEQVSSLSLLLSLLSQSSLSSLSEQVFSLHLSVRPSLSLWHKHVSDKAVAWVAPGSAWLRMPLPRLLDKLSCIWAVCVAAP